jgi:hypothetical protein
MKSVIVVASVLPWRRPSASDTKLAGGRPLIAVSWLQAVHV